MIRKRIAKNYWCGKSLLKITKFYWNHNLIIRAKTILAEDLKRLRLCSALLRSEPKAPLMNEPG